jgi:FkbM family methyltransferase
MRFYERIASAIVGTPLQWPAEQLRELANLPRRWRHPELSEVMDEGRLVAHVIERAVQRDTNCIDVGAHLGSVLARLVKAAPQGRHIAVEPIPYKARWLRRKFPAVDIREAAVGESDKTVEFFLDSDSSAFSGLRKQGPGEATKLQVSCMRLDEIAPKDYKTGFVKIDVEGGELGAFRGARRLLSESRPLVLFECTKSGLEAFGLDARDVFLHLCGEAGYRIFLIKDWLASGPPLELEPFRASMRYPFRAFNYIAAPRS